MLLHAGVQLTAPWLVAVESKRDSNALVPWSRKHKKPTCLHDSLFSFSPTSISPPSRLTSHSSTIQLNSHKLGLSLNHAHRRHFPPVLATTVLRQPYHRRKSPSDSMHKRQRRSRLHRLRDDRSRQRTRQSLGKGGMRGGYFPLPNTKSKHKVSSRRLRFHTVP